MRCSNYPSLIFSLGRKHTLTLPSLLLPYLLHQHTRCNHRHVITRCCLVIAHSLFDVTYMQAFQELYCQTLFVTVVAVSVARKSLWRFEVLTVVKMSMLVLWIVMPCGLVSRYQHQQESLEVTFSKVYWIVGCVSATCISIFLGFSC
jgi:amino acid transporter